MVGCDEFVIFKNFNNISFGDKIQTFVKDVVKSSHQNNLHKYGWLVSRLQILHNIKAEEYSHF